MQLLLGALQMCVCVWGAAAYLDWDDVCCLRLQRPPRALFTWESFGVRLSRKAQSEPVKGSVAQS